jgi:phospholipid transport system substrate-binding protein
LPKPYIFLSAALIAAAPALAATGDPADRLSRYDDGVIAIMKAKLPLGQRIARFEPLVNSYYDMPASAALVVGPSWSNASAADRQAAITALAHHSAVTLARNFDSYDGQRFTVDPAVQSRGTSQVVKLTIQGRSSSNTLLYQMRRGSDGQWRIVDVVADGVSQLSVQRSDMASTVASGGAAGLAKRLGQLDAKAR